MTNYNNRAVNAGKLMSELGVVHINRYIDSKWKPKKLQNKWKPLSLWQEDAASLKELVSYVKRVTDEKSRDYIPPRDRIVVIWTGRFSVRRIPLILTSVCFATASWRIPIIKTKPRKRILNWSGV